MAEPIKHFTDLNVWRKAHQLFLEMLRDVDEWPSSRASAILAEQLIRSLGSVCANIAEGFNRSQKRFVNCLDIAAGEANEAENWLYKARDAGLLGVDAASQRLRAIMEVERMLGSLKAKIAASSSAREQDADYLLGEPDDPPCSTNN